MRRAALILAALAALSVFAGAALAGRIVRVGKQYNGKTVALRTGDTLVVSLPGNATTGYYWRVRAVDRSVLRPAGWRYVPRRTNPPRVGAGGTYVLRFRAVGDGNTRLKLAYVQSGSTRAARTFALGVIVKSIEVP